MTIDIEKRDGIKLHLIPVAALLGWFYKKNLVSYAAELSDIPAPRYAACDTAAASASENVSASSDSHASAETTSGTASAASGKAASGNAAGTASAIGSAAASGSAKAIGTGIAIKAAAAVITAAAIGAGAWAVTHSGSTVAAEGTDTTTESQTGESGGNIAEDGQSATDNTAANDTAADIMLSDEEIALLKEAYSYIDDTSENSYIAPMYLTDRELFYDIYDRLSGRTCIFTGEGFEDSGTGRGVYLKDCNTLYVGTLSGGQPEGFGKLVRWDWFYDTVSSEDNSETYILPGIYANEYDGEWYKGKANGDGISYGNFGMYQASDMSELGARQLDFSFKPNAPIFRTKSVFRDDLANGETERSYSDGIHYSFIASDGYIDPDGLPANGRKEEKYGATYYTFDIMNGVNTVYSVKSDILYKNNCPWDVQSDYQEPKSYDVASVRMDGTVNAAMEAELADELSANMPFELVPDFFRKLNEAYGDRLGADQYYDVLYDDIEYADDHMTVSFEGDDGLFTFTYYYE